MLPAPLRVPSPNVIPCAIPNGDGVVRRTLDLGNFHTRRCPRCRSLVRTSLDFDWSLPERTNQRCSGVANSSLRWPLRVTTIRISGCTPNEENGASIHIPLRARMRWVPPASSLIGRTPSEVSTLVSPARQWY
jgi:hypothetical protein